MSTTPKDNKWLFHPEHPLWLAGFRPLFALAMVAGVLLPLVWALTYSGVIEWRSAISPLQWHAHEMLYGFGWAVLGGFLLTASKNWVSVRGIHGWPLMALVVLWLTERFAVFLPVESWMRVILLNGFEVATAIYILQTLLLHRQKDTYPDNFFFYFALLAFVVAKNLFLQPSTYGHGMALTVGLFRLAFAVMFERTITQFLKNTEGVELVRNRLLDYMIKLAVALSALQSFFAEPVAAAILLLAALLLLLRWFLWKPQIGFRKFGNGVMYVGYLGLVLHLIFEALKLLAVQVGLAAFSLHVFTFVCMGMIIPGMLVRISQGHTGRKPEFVKSDRIAIMVMGLAGIVRLLLPLIYPAAYSWWIGLAGLLWSGCFLLIGWRLIPFLLRPRIDGKIH